jgi:hypothetical protein
VENNTFATSSRISIDDVTNAQGMLNIVDAPPGTGYSISVSNTGYSSDRTYPSGGSGNPNPSKPDATVVIQQVTQISFSIDRVSTINFQSIDAQCQSVPNIPFTFQGAKLIGTPNVYKYSANLNTGSSGSYSQNNFEWDSYALALTSGSYDLMGSNPLLPLNLLPNSTQTVQLVVAPKNPETLLVGVVDSSNGLPITDADVTLSLGGFTKTLTTGRGFTKQTDWSGGSGQTDFTLANKYFSDDGNVDVTTTAGELTLAKIFGNYQASGTLTSSIFDLGTTTVFKQITWNPNDQPVGTGTSSARFQISASNFNTSTTTWNYVGPDGTSGSYFTTANQNISSGNQGRYFRYKSYLQTASSTLTPNISDVQVTYTSSCVPPGQAVFTGLSNGTYTLGIIKPGYQDYSGTVSVNSAYKTLTIPLSP